ncbi:MAG TPA: hypothetical protein VK586_17545 [Streptosporangiaceae bacterium]|nr:hypothetical protein [Streptosporangiaceae bacterium]
MIAWQQVLSEAGIDLSVWRIHRRIGMSGGLFVAALMRETGVALSECDVESLQQGHAREYLKLAGTVRPLPGASALLAALTERGVRWAIATDTGPHMVAERDPGHGRARPPRRLRARTSGRSTRPRWPQYARCWAC